ncbi:MAG: DUF309 domain-containing protein [Candidatus Sericytochromatia bacterium]
MSARGAEADAAAALADRAAYLEGLARFNAGDYHASHDAIEDLWLRNRSAARPFFQGLIQLAAAGLHLERGRKGPALALLRQAEARLRPFEAGMLGLEVAPLLLEMVALGRHIGSLGAHRQTDCDRCQMAQLRYTVPSCEDFFPHRGVAPHPLDTRRSLVAPR